MKKEETKSLQLLLPSNETTVSIGDTIGVMDTLNLFFGMPARPLDLFPLQLTNRSIIIVLKGDVKFKVNFRDYVASDSTCVVFTPGTIVEHVDMGLDAQIIHLSYAFENSPLVSGIFSLQPRQVELLKTTYGILRDIMTDNAFEAGREGVARRCIELMESITQQGDQGMKEGVAKSSRKEEIAARFLKCVQENYREYRDLSFYAERLGLSLKYMSKVVFEQTGRHPSQWIKDHVILDAKAMLRSGQYTVQQVADELHFPNQSFFGKYFKEAVGVSPKKWH